MSSLSKELGLKLRERRRALGLTQDTIAEITGFHHDTIARAERGIVIKLAVLETMLDVLGLDLMVVTALNPSRNFFKAKEQWTALYKEKVFRDGDVTAALVRQRRRAWAKRKLKSMQLQAAHAEPDATPA